MERQQYASRMAAMYSSDRIEQMAAEWLAKQDGGGAWGASEEWALSVWLDASIAHRVAYLRLAEAWRRSAQLKAAPGK